jgi:hypothetical protein
MSSNGTFFTFPLCLLAIPAQNEKHRLQLIVSHALRRAGDKGNIHTDDVRRYIVEHDVSGYNNKSEAHQTLIRGAIICRVDLLHLPSTAESLRQCNLFVDEHQRRYGSDALVFISTELFWGCHNADEPSFREFTLLCAINSICGLKSPPAPVLIRRTMLIARQLGFKSPAVMRAAKKPEQIPLTTKQLRNALDCLETRNLIRRCQASRTCVYFTTSLSEEELREKVKKRVEQRRLVQTRRELDRQWLSVRPKQGPNEGHLKTNPTDE